MLTNAQISLFEEQGFLLVENLLSKEEVDLLISNMNEIIQEDCPRRILEKSGSVRSFFAPNMSNEVFNNVSRLAKIVKPAAELLGGEVYLHQTKINSKAAMVGDWWEWHQDFVYWHQDDGMAAPDVLTAMIFLNPINEFNGPLVLIPGSHKIGVVDNEENKGNKDSGSWYADYLESAPYMASLTADLKYKLTQETVAKWAQKNGLFSCKGAEGTVLFFHGNIFHASSNNLSPWDRFTYLITYNKVDNKLPDRPNPRPEFIAMRDFEPIVPVDSIF